MTRELTTFLQEVADTTDNETFRHTANGLLDSLSSRTFVLFVSDGMTSQAYGPITTSAGVDKVRAICKTYANKLGERVQPGAVEVRAMEVFSLEVMESMPWGAV
jgi:hypothetical protein